jgi:hypothetical protein
MRAMLPLGVVLACAACGVSVESTHRGAYHTPVEPYLVGVTESAPPRPFKVITASVHRLDMRSEALPSAPDAVIDAMKRYAASRGAKMRRVYGWGLVWVDEAEAAAAAPGECKHFGFAAGLNQAQAEAQACLARLKGERPGLAGAVEILFEVDAWGSVRQAAPSPASSRDTQVHGCAMLAVHRASYGLPEGLWCRGKLSTQVP